MPDRRRLSDVSKQMGSKRKRAWVSTLDPTTGAALVTRPASVNFQPLAGSL